METVDRQGWILNRNAYRRWLPRRRGQEEGWGPWLTSGDEKGGRGLEGEMWLMTPLDIPLILYQYFVRRLNARTLFVRCDILVWDWLGDNVKWRDESPNQTLPKHCQIGLLAVEQTTWTISQIPEYCLPEVSDLFSSWVDWSCSTSE